jgi:crotonobetainyl-CoA:carnitine CoA-transferase CaiB-like acyl-CoA transferase
MSKTTDLSNGPLTGIRILDLTSVVLGPLATQILGDYGAEVIKVESLEGDLMRSNGVNLSPSMSSIFLSINRNKQSIAIDLKTEAGKKILRQLIPRVDAVVHNMRVSAIDKLGFGYDEVVKLNPQIVYCAATGFDQDGPDKDRPAFDDIIQAACGLASVNSLGKSRPDYISTLVADKTTGMALVNAVLAALLAKERSGQGQYVEVPMLETMVAFTLVEHMGGLTRNPATQKAGYSRVLSGGRQPSPTRDGFIAMLPYTNHHWESFFRDAGQEALGKELGVTNRVTRNANIQGLYAALHAITATRTTAEWIEICDRLDIPATPIYTMEELPSHPQLQAVQLFEDVVHPDVGAIRYVRPPVKFSKTPAKVRHQARRLGQDTESILTDLGYSQNQIESLVNQRAIVNGK